MSVEVKILPKTGNSVGFEVIDHESGLRARGRITGEALAHYAGQSDGTEKAYLAAVWQVQHALKQLHLKRYKSI